MRKLLIGLLFLVNVVGILWIADTAAAGEATVTGDCDGWYVTVDEKPGWTVTIDGVPVGAGTHFYSDAVNETRAFQIVWTRDRDGLVAAPSGEYVGIRPLGCLTTTTTEATTTTVPVTTTTVPVTTTVPATTTTVPATTTTTVVRVCVDSDGDGIKRWDTDGDGIEDGAICEHVNTGSTTATAAVIAGVLAVSGVGLLAAADRINVWRDNR